MNSLSDIQISAIDLLKDLIATPSFSTMEGRTADLMERWFKERGIPHQRHLNNVWAVSKHFDPHKPSILLNSHHDTVRPNKAYTKDPFTPEVLEGRLYGLGSNDAGGPLVSLLASFTYLWGEEQLPINLVYAATAEEEINGSGGIAALLPELPPLSAAIVGEPTKMQMAIAEKGLIVFDAEVHGTPSHAAHPNSDNAIYKTARVLDWFQGYRFEKISDTLGEVKMTVTQLEAGSQHNVVPAHVQMVVDVRVTDQYTNREINDILVKEAPVDKLKARSLRLNSSGIPKDHFLVQAGLELGMKTYGSPTLSDQALLDCPSLKLGPGDSLRSHSADEFIYLEEIYQAIEQYVLLLRKAGENLNHKNNRHETLG